MMFNPFVDDIPATPLFLSQTPCIVADEINQLKTTAFTILFYFGNWNEHKTLFERKKYGIISVVSMATGNAFPK